MKKTYVLISLIIIVIAIFSLKNYTTATKQLINGKYLITGNIHNETGQELKGINVKLNKDTGECVGSTVTDKYGNYSFTTESGEYSIQIDDQYEINSVNGVKYDLYTENTLDLAFVYPQTADYSVSDDRIEIFNSMFANNQYNIAKQKYIINSTEKKLDAIRLLQNSDGENTFATTAYVEGFKRLGVLISNSTIEEDTLSSYPMPLGVDWVVTGSNKTKDIVKSICEKLGKSAIELSNINISSNLVSKISVSSPTIIDFKLKKIVEDNNIGTGSFSIYGKCNYINTDSDSEDVINNQKYKFSKISLCKESGDTVSELNLDNFNYEFKGYPGDGKYYVEMTLKNEGLINGQNYKLDKTKCNGYSELNRLDINNAFSSIDYNKENDLNNGNILPLIIKTDTFELSSHYNTLTNTTEYKVNGTNITNLERNFILKQREKFLLTVNEDINRYKIVLSNGQVYQQYKQGDNDEFKNLRLFNINFEDKLRYGATVFIEYKITVTNNSNIKCDGFTLLNRIENLRYDEKQHLLNDINANNKTQGWELIKNDTQGVENLTGKCDTKEATVYLKLESSDIIKKDQSKDYYVTLTMPLDAGDECVFESTAELVKYGNGEGRRNYSIANLTGTATDNIIQAGNYDYENNLNKELDTGISERLVIIPPTGIDKKIIYMLLSCFTLIGVKIIIKSIKRGGK